MNTQTAEKTVELEKFLVRASAIIKALGYVSNSDVKGTDKKSTAMLALAWADDSKPKEIMNITFDYSDKVTGKEVAEWMGKIDTSHIASQDYMFSLANIGITKTVTERNAGYAASAIKAFEKEKNKISSNNSSLEDLKKVFGAVGAKLQPTTVIFIGKSQFDSRFGICHKYQFEDGSGRKLTWMTSTELTELKQGNAYSLSGTIKEYSSYREKHECQVTRAKVIG